VEAVKKLPGVRAVAESLLLWVFDGDRFMLIIGLQPENPLGAGNLKHFLTDGDFFGNGESIAVLDASYARDEGIRVGDTITILEKEYCVGGIVDSSRTSKMLKAHIYLPLPETQALAAASPQVQAVSPFGADDVNVVFALADSEAMSGLSGSIKSIMGDKVVVSSAESFLQSLGSLFALSDTFALATSLIVIGIVLLLVLKTVAGGLQERAREIAVLKCVGWRNGNILRQLLAETLAQCLIAGLLGVIVAVIVCWLLSFQTLNIPIPWEMSPSPHFLPGGSDAMFKTVRLPVGLSWPMAFFAVLVSLAVGAATCFLCAGRITKIKPSEVLRHE
jgi:putative ABC transport system permease protein